jgi:hypothetical protein
MATVETELVARTSKAVDDEISGFVEGLTTVIAAHVQASTDRVSSDERAALADVRATLEQKEQETQALEQALREERAQADVLRRELQAEKDRADAARAGRKQSELAFREAEAALRQATGSRAAADEELRQVHESLEATRTELAQSTKVFEDALQDMRIEHTSAMEEQAVTWSSLPLDELLTLFATLATSTTVSDALTTLVKGLALEFSRVALFGLHDGRLEGVQQSGFDLNSDFSKVAISLGGDSLLAHAVTSKRIESCAAGVESEHRGIPFGGTPTCALALPIVVRGETLAVVYADDSDQVEFMSPSLQPRMKFADLLLQHVVLVLVRISAEQHARAELREYAKTLLSEIRYGYLANLEAGKTAVELQSRMIDDLECSRRIFAQRSSQEGPEASIIFEEELAAVLDEVAPTGFGRDLAHVVGHASSASKHLAS